MTKTKGRIGRKPLAPKNEATEPETFEEQSSTEEQEAGSTETDQAQESDADSEIAQSDVVEVIDPENGEITEKTEAVESKVEPPPAEMAIVVEEDGRAVVGLNRVHDKETAIALARKWGWPDERITVNGEKLSAQTRDARTGRKKKEKVKAEVKEKVATGLRWKMESAGNWTAEFFGVKVEARRGEDGVWKLFRDGEVKAESKKGPELWPIAEGWFAEEFANQPKEEEVKVA